MKNIVLFLFLTYFQCILSKNPGRIKILDAKNSRIYRGPENPNRRDLSSYILRAKPTVHAIRYYTGKVFNLPIN